MGSVPEGWSKREKRTHREQHAFVTGSFRKHNSITEMISKLQWQNFRERPFVSQYNRLSKFWKHTFLEESTNILLSAIYLTKRPWGIKLDGYLQLFFPLMRCRCSMKRGEVWRYAKYSLAYTWDGLKNMDVDVKSQNWKFLSEECRFDFYRAHL